MNQNDAHRLWEQIRPNLDEALCCLKPVERDAITLHYLQGMSSTAASEVLGCQVRTFNARLHAGLSSLKSQLQRRGIAVTAPALLVMMDTCPLEQLPAGLAVSIQNVCHGESVPTSQVSQAASELSKCSLRVIKSLGASTSWPVLPILVVAAAAAATTVGLSLRSHSEAPPPAALAPAVQQQTLPAAKKAPVELFTKAEHLSKWKIEKPDWRVEGNTLVGKGQQVNSFISIKDVPNDFLLEITATAQTAYHFGWWGGGIFATHVAWDPPGTVRLRHWEEQQQKKSTELASAPLSPGKHKFTVVSVGENLALLADGKPILACKQPAGQRSTQFGIFVYKRGSASFENITVREASEKDLPNP